MKISEMHWAQIAERLRVDDRAVLPLGSTEQHAGLSLSVDPILSERVATEAAEPLGVPVFPALPYGITPYFLAYPGSVSIRVETYVALVRDILDSLYGQGFRRILLVNGHGGNQPAGSLAIKWMADHPDAAVKVHNGWNAPKTSAKVQEIADGSRLSERLRDHRLRAGRRRRRHLRTLRCPADVEPGVTMKIQQLETPPRPRRNTPAILKWRLSSGPTTSTIPETADSNYSGFVDKNIVDSYNASHNETNKAKRGLSALLHIEVRGILTAILSRCVSWAGS